MKYRIVEKPAFTAVGWALETSCIDGENFREIPRFWGSCHAEGKIAALAPLAGTWGLLGVCAEWDEHRENFTYLIGVEKTGAGSVFAAGTRGIEVPTATYAVFQSVGAMPAAIQEVTIQAYAEWYPTSGYEHAGSPDFELYPPFPPGDPRGDTTSAQYTCEVWIPIRKKRG